MYARTRAVMAGANQFQVNPSQPKGSPGGSGKTPTDPNTTTTILNGSAALCTYVVQTRPRVGQTLADSGLTWIGLGLTWLVLWLTWRDLGLTCHVSGLTWLDLGLTWVPLGRIWGRLGQTVG